MTQASPTTAAPPSSVASAILKRRAERQRFDSADFAMAQQQQKQQLQRLRLPSCDEARRVPAPASLDSSDDFSDWVQCEFEPEPDAVDALTPSSTTQTATLSSVTIPPQQVRRIRLQRFDSADFAMKANTSVQPSAAAGTTASSLAGTVAKLRLERHAYATCSFVSTALDAPEAQHFVKNA